MKGSDHSKQYYSFVSGGKKLDPKSPSIMQSLDSITALEPNGSPQGDNVGDKPKICTLKQFESTFDRISGSDHETRESFQVISSQEILQVPSAEQFLSKLGIPSSDVKVKVVSIFGNIGDGKSYTLNNAFFENKQVFKTSSSCHSACTLGVWIAYEPKLQILCLDSQGLQGSVNAEPQTTRLLLKVLAVSDIVIFRTQSERLPKELFNFLGSASKAFTHHFLASLQGVGGEKSGPAVVVFHESRHTKPLQHTVIESPEDMLRNHFAELEINMEAFKSVHYVGLQAFSNTDFSQLISVVQAELDDNSVRPRRSPVIVFEMFRVLNEKFSGEIGDANVSLFPDEYLTCTNVCLSCGKRCEHSVGHLKEGKPHSNSSKCRFQQNYENQTHLCKRCLAKGVEQTVMHASLSDSASSWYGLAKYMLSGYKISCPNCGEIYSSRQYWYGNKTPEESKSVKTKVVHVWSGSECREASQNTGQKVMDGVAYISEAVASLCSQPTKMLSSYVADQIAPKYWRPNDQIKHCHGCKKWFAPTVTKHHCRNCGEGFCESCSSHYVPVPKYGWNEPVRVCANCNVNLSKDSPRGAFTRNPRDMDIRARRYGEVVISTLSAVANVLEYPKELIKESTRPSYWVPDDRISECCICKLGFGMASSLHHCRACGRGVCAKCSANKRPVPERNWDHPVRVCDECLVNPD